MIMQNKTLKRKTNKTNIPTKGFIRSLNSAIFKGSRAIGLEEFVDVQPIRACDTSRTTYGKHSQVHLMYRPTMLPKMSQISIQYKHVFLNKK